MTARFVSYNLRIAAVIFAVFASMASAQSGSNPGLPLNNFDYVGFAVDDLPNHFGDGRFGTVTSHDNTPADNPITNAGATLGRVLFYDRRLSHNNSMSCASCHHQENGFADPIPSSTGVNGAQTPRHSMGLTNAKFYDNGRFLSDESAETLEVQVLMPIVNPDELGTDLAVLPEKLGRTDFYGDLFQDAFGSREITEDRISKSMAQFVRSMTSYNSKFDQAFDEDGTPNFENGLTDQEQRGHALFTGVGRCSFCHVSDSQVAGDIHNNGLDAVTIDDGAGDGKFKSPSLRNAEVRGVFMHDGRFQSLEEVVDFYSSEIADNPDLDFRLRDDSNGNQPFQPNFSQEQKDALVAFLKTLTDWDFLTNENFSDPFGDPCDFDGNSTCDVDDLNMMLAAGPLNAGVEVVPTIEIFDMNGDGILNQDDTQRWLAEAGDHNGLAGPYLLGDANLDGRVDVSDFNAWNSSKFTETSRWDRGDFNGDGFVDVSDFNSWNQRKFQEVAPTEVVPEPASWILLLIAISLASRKIRRVLV